MPYIYRSDLKNFTRGKRLPDEKVKRGTFYYNKSVERKGGSVLSSVGSLFNSGAKIIKGNKDLIIQGAKAAGSTASAVSKVVDAVKENQELKDLELIRKVQNESKSKKISPATKKKIEDLSKNPDQKGDGFAKF